MKNPRIFRYLWFAFLALFAATFSGCNSKKSDQEPDTGKAQQIGSELKSIGKFTTDVLEFDLKCKSNGNKLYWILKVRQTVFASLGIGGYSDDDAASMAKRIVEEFQSTTTEGRDGSQPQNKIEFEFIDSNGFMIAAATTDEISPIDDEGEIAYPLREGWYYRGIIDLNSSEISRISSCQLQGAFSNEMNGLLHEASGFVEKKKKERNK